MGASDLRGAKRPGRLAMSAIGAVLIFGAGNMVMFVGCSGARGVNVPPGSDELEPCPFRTIAVSDLVGEGVPGCDLAGSELSFPGSEELTISGVGAVYGRDIPSSSTSYIIVNWGVPGVGAYMTHKDRLVQVWASGPEAQALQYEQARVNGVNDVPPKP